MSEKLEEQDEPVIKDECINCKVDDCSGCESFVRRL